MPPSILLSLRFVFRWAGTRKALCGLLQWGALNACVSDVVVGEEASLVVDRVRAHTTFLASDALEGRGAGTRGHAIAMEYVAAQFRRLGIRPVGDNGYLQPVAMRESRLNLEAGRFVIRHAGQETALAIINDTIVRPAPNSVVGEVSAPAVFAGFAIHAPEFGYDDFGNGVDVRGKIAVVLAGSPRALPATARAHYSRQKHAELVRRGAVGLVTIGTPGEEARYPWALAANRARFPAMRLIQADGTLFEAYPELRVIASVSQAAGAALFTHAPHRIDAVFAASERSEPQAFSLNLELSLSGEAEVSDTDSANVLGWLPGTDETLAAEPIVVTGHLDHLGIGPAVEGDTIYNGALDNALGIAIMLAAAEELSTGPRPRRPILFAALTAEEKGLLGATQLARHPPVGVRRYAANLNIDMPIILASVHDVVGIGAQHTNLGATLEHAAARTGFTVSPDPLPDEVIFVRSDQYEFVRAGVPALLIAAGTKPLDGDLDLAALNADFRRNHYHKPSDDLSRPIHWESAGAFVQLTAEFLRTAADNAEPPSWLPGDFFGTLFGSGHATRP